MRLWNFTHSVLNMHVFVFLALIILEVMLICFAFQYARQKERVKKIKRLQEATEQTNANRTEGKT